MNVARHHNEWLSLLDISGPFVSLPVLLRIFPQGLDRRDADQAARLRESYEDWIDRGDKLPAVHHAWIRHVLNSVLAYPANLLAEGQAIPPGLEAVLPTVHETLRPDMALKRTEGDQKPILLISTYAASQDLQKPVNGKLWKASPGTRMMELLHAADVPIGLVTNGEEWMLVSARRGDTTGFASWFADLWMQEPLTLRAFHSLLHLRRLIGVAESDTLPNLVVESSKDQQEVTDQLGYQVRDAVEVLVQAFDRIDAESGRKLLVAVDEKTLYDGALTVMMRLVFLFSAEERHMLLLGDPLYDQNYAVSTLSELLRERADQHGEEVLERRHDAWCRLLATFRAIYGGVEHEAMRLPPYGGTLFDPDRFPFLEGRPIDGAWQNTAAKPLVINNRVVLHLLEALQVLRVKVPGGGPAEARRLSFSALDIEQIGHVYEGLLDHTAKRASEPILGLGGSKDKEPEVALRALEELARKGPTPLVEFLHEKTGRSDNALKHLLEEESESDHHALLIACGQDDHLALRVRPFASLLRRDSFGRLVVIQTGSIYVTSGSDRRTTGTHYTPRSLTEPVVRYTLEPLAYVGPAAGLAPAEWTLRNPKEILALKVCDMAMGSGAFLVESCRYLADRLVEAWENAEREYPGSFVVTPDGQLSTGSPTERLIPSEAAERIAVARRYIADRCLYGVDINPMAVEMAKLSLWLVTLQRDRPFTFLDHALKCGDSLLGIRSVKQVENFSVRDGVQQVTFETADLVRAIEEASSRRLSLEDLPSSDYNQIAAKTRLHIDAESAVARVRAISNALVAFELRGLDGQAYDDARTTAAAAAEATSRGPLRELTEQSSQGLGKNLPFHWALEFPEAIGNGGFDAFVGNPPFMGGTKLEPAFGADWREFIVRNVGANVRGLRGTGDLCAYFFLRAETLLRPGGCFGLIGTNTLAQGDTRELGLEQLAKRVRFVRATSSQAWPGTANLEISQVWAFKGDWGGARWLDGREVSAISSFLKPSEQTNEKGKPLPLTANSNQSFEGVKTLGLGFLLPPLEAERLIVKDKENKRVLFPYLNGDDLNSRFDQSPTRWAINFRDWPLRRSDAPEEYEGPVAEDFVDCLRILEDKVKPERLSYPADSSWNRGIRTRWWQFALWRPALHEALRGRDRALVVTRVSKHLICDWALTDLVFSDAVVVITREDDFDFACLQSSCHDAWARLYGSTLETRMRYTGASCFDTFPFPPVSDAVRSAGANYHHRRKQLMLSRQDGLTKIYNAMHTPNETCVEIAQMRALHTEMDQLVTAAYGWTDLDLGHGFHDTKYGVRYTLSESARGVVLDRLLELNHQRYAEEKRTGLHNKKAAKAKRSTASRTASTQRSLL